MCTVPSTIRNPVDYAGVVKVNKTAGCWIWKGTLNGIGYGRFWDRETKREVLAHRYSYEKLVGQIPKDQYVLHKCDNPACYNPDHLFLGTQKDNIQDSIKKGRFRYNWPKKGEAHYNSRLTQEQIEAIRTRYSWFKVTQKQLAKEFGVSQSHICNILHGVCWG